MWMATGSMATARYLHTATLLPNGQVLVAGGYGGLALASGELYDPATGVWTETGSRNCTLSYTATLLPNGQVLVAGGVGPFYLGCLGTAELYDPATGVWTGAGHMAKARARHTATLLPNGLVLVAGGVTHMRGTIRSGDWDVDGDRQPRH